MSPPMSEWEILAATRARQRVHSRLRRQRLDAARALATHTEPEWLALKARANGVCPRCLCPAERLVKDHVNPIYAGGSDGIENLQPLCPRCNSQKGRERIDWLAHRGQR